MTRQPILVSLQQAIQDFFEKYLTIERNASRNTILAYRDAFRLYLQHAAEKHGVTVDQLDDSILELDTVRSFSSGSSASGARPHARAINASRRSRPLRATSPRSLPSIWSAVAGSGP